jgi:hypothetical protein
VDLKGADFKKVTKKELGKYDEVEDQIQAARQLGDMLYVDAAPRHLGAGVMEAL